MEINSLQLKAFFAIAKCLNFTRAAKQLFVTQSALSQRIAKLEDELGTTLFIRDRTSIRLTEAGSRLLRYCQFNQMAEEDLLANLRSTSEEFAGVLRIGGFSSINRSLVIPALKKLMLKNSRLSIQLLTKEVRELSDLLLSSEADYIFTTNKPSSSDVECLFMGYEDNVLVKLKKSPNVEIYLDHDENDVTTKSYFRQNKIAFKPSTMRYLDDVYGLIDGVKSGYGKAVVPFHLIEDDPTIEIIDRKRVLRVPVYLQFYTQPYYRRIHSALIEDVQGFLREKLRQGK
jgi:DNA-binding transcriptional LysR family regulator